MHTFNRLLIDVYANAQHCSLAEFNEYGLRELKKVVTFDSCVLVDLAITPERKLAFQTLHLHATPIERLQDRIQSIGQETLKKNGGLSSMDLTLVKAFEQRGQSIVADLAASSNDPQILSYCRKYETAHSLAFVSSSSFGRSVPALGLWRASKKNAYSRQHAHDATLFLPHLLQAREINCRFKPGTSAEPVRQALVLSTLKGQLYFIDDDTVQLLQSEWKSWTPPFLPPALMDALGSTGARQFVGKRITVQAEVRDRMLSLSITSHSRQHARLTPTELRIASLAAQGMQYKEIAKQTGAAPATIRNHLHAVYRKLGVANKTALALALSAH